MGTTAFLYTLFITALHMKPPFKGALFEQNAHLQFKYKLVFG